MVVLSAVSEWEHYLCSRCSTMSALRPGTPMLTVIDPLLRWPAPAFTSEDSTTDTDELAADIGSAEAEVSTAPPLALAPATSAPAASMPGADTVTIVAPIDAVASDPEAVPMSTRMREIVVQAERTDNPWGI